MNQTEVRREFSSLARQAQACRLCSRMADSRAVLSHRNGNLHAKILFIAEAPGRLGAARSGVPLCGDQSGRNFERLLAASGLTRSEIFVTNAVLCNPQDEQGRNAAPRATEQSNCLSFLARTVEVLDPALIITLGAVALRSLAAIEGHGLSLRRDVGKVAYWQGRTLVPLFHPSPRAQIHRPFEVQLQDFVGLRPVLDTIPRH